CAKYSPVGGLAWYSLDRFDVW
nr:immunoglobulin heavy chain junction region [Macaca mulatta]MOW45597.1 immunoglobulin heavy chain junction region [Macaca mulatta]MOW45714.1 immunoglobulin heavy chain junction region [Macaca mulatta]MOW45897.1 immunoglobulin heavy chain junction region [Macaca mulatta]MOW46061.1 immunoglobulin heavy chain junction region [Macaca mulatta]